MCYVAIGDVDEVALAAKFAVMRPFLDERGWRVYLGTEANALGYGGIAAVARASGASETTVAAGAGEAADQESLEALEPGRSRRPGAGRPKAEDAQPGLKEALDGLLEEGKRGDPMSAVTWNILSLRDIARQMALLGFSVSKDTIARLMHEDGYSLQGMSRVLEGNQHEDRDAQFGHLNAKIAEHVAAGEPAISVDGKKKEKLGAYHRDGKSWQRKGDPVQVRGHDFPDKDTVTISPYGIYDIASNRGFVSVGTSCDTAAFAVNAIRLWWQKEGSLRYPHATRLLITCDAGLNYAQSGPQSVRLTVNGIARALGKLGDTEDVHCAVDRAYDLMSRNDVPRGVPSSIALECYSATQTASNAATAYVSLGMPEKVQHYVGVALPDISKSDSPWSRSLVMIDLARSLISCKDADLDHAVALVLEALGISAGRPIISVRQRAAEFVRDATRRWGNLSQVSLVRDALSCPEAH
jgi:hypothetical protein